LARELGAHGITVNAVAPGITMSLEEPPEQVRLTNERRVGARSIKRDQKPEDLVGSVVFLLTPDSDFMTG